MDHYSEILDARILKALKEKGYQKFTEIQEQAIPKLVDSKKNFFGQANTGTGKTAAFVIPAIQKIDEDDDSTQCLVLAPTRELAIQVESEFKSMAKYTNARSVCIYGGVSYDKQIREINKGKPQVVIGTPGRIIDLLKRGVLNFDNVKSFVLDEADEMLNMGFLDDVELILEDLQKECQLVMFSATMPRRISSLLRSSFGSYDLVKVENKKDFDASIDQRFVLAPPKYFADVLERIVESTDSIYAIVFCRTKSDTYRIGDLFAKRRIAGDVLNGDMGQNERERVVSKFKRKEINVLVCTDVAARGLDIDNLTHVINVGVPQNTESYIHRIGRTGRAGMKGMAITLVSPSDFYFIKNVERSTKSEIKKYTVPTAERLKKVTIDREIAAIAPLLDSVREKGEDYRMDDSYEFFTNHFSDFDRDELLKIMFKWQFNEKMRRFNQLPDLDEAVYSARGSRNEKRGNSRGRRGGYSSDRSRGGQRSGRRKSGSGAGGERRDRSERRGRSERSERGGEGNSPSRRSRAASKGRSPHKGRSSRDSQFSR